MGLFDSFVDAVSEVGGAVVDTVVETVSDTVIDPLVDTVEEAVGGVVESVQTAVDLLPDTPDWFDAATSQFGGMALSLADDLVFDHVDYLTGGALDVDYDDGNFSANVDLGVASAGVHYGEDGMGANLDLGALTLDVDYADGGLSAGGTFGGVGPLPLMEGHVNINADGTIDVAGQVQGTLWTPVGSISTNVEGGFHRLPDGSWGAYGGVEGSVITPGGMTVSSGGAVSYESEADGDVNFSTGGHAGVGMEGGPSVEVGGEFERTEVDGESDISVAPWVAVDGIDPTDLVEAAASFLGEGADTEPGGLPDTQSVSDTVSDLAGSGDLSEVLTGMADESGQSIADVAGGLSESGNFDDFSADIVSTEVAEAAADETWDDLLG